MLISVACFPLNSISGIYNRISSLKPTLILETSALLSYENALNLKLTLKGQQTNEL